MTAEELHDIDNRLTLIASHPNLSAEDARYAMTCALQLVGEVKRLTAQSRFAGTHFGASVLDEPK